VPVATSATAAKGGDERQHAGKDRQGSTRKQPCPLPVQVSHEVVNAVADGDVGADHNQNSPNQGDDQPAQRNDERRIHFPHHELSSLFFAGEACSRNDYSTAHGAYLTGVTAAEQVIAARGKG
jgi:hypothetical protein